MIPGGYGFEVLRFENDDLREISILPKDVRIVCALPDLPERHGYDTPREWHHAGPRLRPVYILICHRYCVRVQPGCTYQFTGLAEFLKRYAELQADEREPLTAPDPHYQMGREAWHMDDDGVAREYVWHETGGWVPR
jgi:hypothetical protein